MNIEQLQQEEESLRVQVMELPQGLRKRYYQQEKKRVKDPDTYAVLNWLLICGLHHFYLGRMLRGTINFVAMLIGLVFMMFTTFPVWGLGIWGLVFLIELPQLFRSQQIVYQYNNRVMHEILAELKGKEK